MHMGRIDSSDGPEREKIPDGDATDRGPPMPLYRCPFTHTCMWAGGNRDEGTRDGSWRVGSPGGIGFRRPDTSHRGARLTDCGRRRLVGARWVDPRTVRRGVRGRRALVRARERTGTVTCRGLPHGVPPPRLRSRSSPPASGAKPRVRSAGKNPGPSGSTAAGYQYFRSRTLQSCGRSWSITVRLRGGNNDRTGDESFGFRCGARSGDTTHCGGRATPGFGGLAAGSSEPPAPNKTVARR